MFREKVNKDSNLKVLSFDQRILLELLTEGGKSFAILQNLALSFDYYESVFRPDKMKDITLDYIGPKIVGEFSKHALNGFIVSSTPNEVLIVPFRRTCIYGASGRRAQAQIFCRSARWTKITTAR